MGGRASIPSRARFTLFDSNFTQRCGSEKHAGSWACIYDIELLSSRSAVIVNFCDLEHSSSRSQKFTITAILVDSNSISYKFEFL